MSTSSTNSHSKRLETYLTCRSGYEIAKSTYDNVDTNLTLQLNWTQLTDPLIIGLSKDTSNALTEVLNAGMGWFKEGRARIRDAPTLPEAEALAAEMEKLVQEVEGYYETFEYPGLVVKLPHEGKVDKKVEGEVKSMRGQLKETVETFRSSRGVPKKQKKKVTGGGFFGN